MRVTRGVDPGERSMTYIRNNATMLVKQACIRGTNYVHLCMAQSVGTCVIVQSLLGCRIIGIVIS